MASYLGNPLWGDLSSDTEPEVRALAYEPFYEPLIEPLIGITP